MRGRFKILALILACTSFTGCISTKPQYTKKEDNNLVIYTALEEEQVNLYLEDFRSMYPEIKVDIIMDSHGVISAKLISEKDNPQADIVWGLSAINMIDIEDKGLLKDYKPKNLNEINKKFMDDDNDTSWIGLTVTESAFVVNEKELEKLGLAVPKSFNDLLKKEYKGLITMPNPASSGTGYFTISGILQMMGEEEGWNYLSDLHENIGMYTHSGSKPAKLASSGEYPIGISFGYRAVTQMNSGDPVKAIFPEEGSGWDLESIALLNKNNIKEESLVFMKWALSHDTMKLYSNNAAVTSIKTDIPYPLGYPENPEKQLIDNDLNMSSKTRYEVLKTWEEKYGAKTEKSKGN